MSRIHYIMFESYTGIGENIYDELGQSGRGLQLSKAQLSTLEHKMMIAVELGVFQQAQVFDNTYKSVM